MKKLTKSQRNRMSDASGHILIGLCSLNGLDAFQHFGKSHHLICAVLLEMITGTKKGKVKRGKK